MKCFLSSMSCKDRECVEVVCNAWNTDSHKCLVLSFLGSYVQHQLVDLKAMGIYDDLKKRIGEE